MTPIRVKITGTEVEVVLIDTVVIEGQVYGICANGAGSIEKFPLEFLKIANVHNLFREST